jgi:hypothetical protein
MMLRRIFRPKRDEIIGGWRKLNNEMGRACSREQSESAYTVLVEKTEGKSLLGRPRCRWEAI